MPAMKWHRIRITDDGKKLSVYFPKKRANGLGTEEVLAVEAEYAGKFAEHHIAIYNRERVGGADHVSWLDNFEIRRPAENK